jgi:hypothetical protein
MAETEGVIKFNLTFRTERVVGVNVAELSAWRTVLKELGLLGQIPGRYDGYGFGNISQRCAGGFVISGTQTGRLEAVTLDDYAVTDETVAYGTPEMAKEVRRLITNMASPGIFSMGGHEDGVFTFGRSLAEAGQLMVHELVRARALT